MLSYLYNTAASATNYLWSYTQYMLGYTQQPAESDSHSDFDFPEEELPADGSHEQDGVATSKDTHKEDKAKEIHVPKRLTHITRTRPARASKRSIPAPLEPIAEKQEGIEDTTPVVQEPEPEVLATPPKRPAGAVAMPGMIKFDPSAVKLKKSPNPKPFPATPSETATVDFRSVLRKSP